MEFPHNFCQVFDRRPEPFRIHHPKLRLAQRHEAGGLGNRFQLRRQQPRARHQSGQSHSETGFPHQNGDPVRGTGFRDRFQSRRRRGLLTVAQARVIEDHAASDGDDRRKHPDDEAVAGKQQGRLAQNQSRLRFRAGAQRGARVDQPDLGFDFGRPGMEMNRRAMLERLGGRQQLQQAIDFAGGMKHSGCRQHHPARQVAGVDVSQVQRRTLSRQRPLGRTAVHLHAADARTPPAGVNLHLFLFAD